MINLEEKIELAKELNLKEQISILEYKKGMFDLIFKKISLNEIKNRLRFYRFKPKLKFSTVSFLVFFLSFLILCLSVKNSWIFWIAIFWSSFFFAMSSFEFTKVESCWVDDFKYEIPHGAMLALKEAGEKGILDHRIHYPVWSNLISELNALAQDPIITGKNCKGELVEIYAWNEDDVYEK